MSRIYVTRAVECPTLAEVVGWMERNGWKRSKYGDHTRYQLWNRSDGHGDIEVPNREDRPDFALRIQQLVGALGAIHDTWSADIYDDIMKHRSET